MKISNEKKDEIKPIIEKISKYITYGMYFGFHIDLTRSMQSQNNSDQTNQESKFGNIDTRYMWNYQMCKDLINQGMNKQWCIPLIQGYVDQ